MIVVYCQHRDALTRAERRMVAAMRDLPGILLVNALVSTGRRTREIDGVWIHPRGVVAVEVKGTNQDGPVVPRANGAWTIGGAPADFASGPNPTVQARTAAQSLRTAVASHAQTGFIPAVLAISGDDLELDPQQVGDVTALLVEDLHELPTHLRPQPIGAADALALLSALELGEDELPDRDELDGEGFEPGTRLAGTPAGAARPGPARPAGGDRTSSRDRRRARRLADLEAQAHDDWHRSHSRRLIASSLAAAVIIGCLPHLPFYTLVNGLVVGVSAAVYQLAVRRSLAGPRHRGPWAATLWALTLAPVAGIGAALSWMAALPGLEPLRWPFVLMLAILLASALGCAVLAGRSAFVRPPDIILERFDEQGRPTGAFTLAGTNPQRWPRGDWRPVEATDDARGAGPAGG